MNFLLLPQLILTIGRARDLIQVNQALAYGRRPCHGLRRLAPAHSQDRVALCVTPISELLRRREPVVCR